MAFVSAAFSVAVPSVPVGSVQPYAGASAPNGWLLCDSGQYLITQYGELYSVLSTTYGALTNGSGGAGTTHFRVPDMRGRVPMGAGTGTGLTARALAANVGTETHTLTIAQMPSHDHGGNTGASSFASATAAGALGLQLVPPSNGVLGNPYTQSHTIASQGTDAPHNNMQPSLVLNYIIKATSDIPRGGITASSTPPIVTSLPANPQFGDQVTYQFTGTNNVGALLLMQYNGTAWKPLGQATLCRWSSGSASQVINSTTVANMTNGDYGSVTFTPPWDGYYEIGINLENVQLTAGIGISVLFNSTTDTYSHRLAYFEDVNGNVYHTKIPVTGPRTEYLYAAQTYRWKASITYAVGNTGTIFSAGNAYVKAVA